MNKTKFSGLALCAALFTTSVHSIENLAHQIEKLAVAEITASNTPSIQISIGLGDQLIYQGAFGLSDIENNVQATTNTKYRTASVAKWFTATAAMKLSQQGLLDLDEPIQRYCPQFPKKEWTITTRQLLTHTSGIRHYVDYPEKLDQTTNDKERTRLEKKQATAIINSFTRFSDVLMPLDSFKDDPLQFRPGSDWEYTSFGYRALACVMQGAAKTDFRPLMQNLIFDPAKMTDTIDDDAWAIIPNRAQGYRLQRGAPIRRADMRDVSENLPAGGYLSTATDMVRFAQAFNSSLLPIETRSLMASPVAIEALDLTQEPSWRDAIPSEDKYGYGVMLLSKYQPGMIGHSGRQAGGSAMLSLIPEQDVSIAVMTNAKGWNGYLSLTMKIHELIEAHLLEKN